MDSRTDTLADRFAGQWAFLSQRAPRPPSSLPPSTSYLHSDGSNVEPPAPRLPAFQPLETSRSSLPERARTSSSAGRTSTTIPSQPVVVPVHSADAAIQIYPSRHPPRPRRNMSPHHDLPPIQEFGIQGILAAIEEDIEDDINAVSEILGRSRLVLADQHDSHLPPQGEIRATGNAFPTVPDAVAHAHAAHERLAFVDDVLILREDASLVDGSHAGSAAYGLLERLQTVPRHAWARSDIYGLPTSRPTTASVRNGSASPTSPDVPAAANAALKPSVVTGPGPRPGPTQTPSSHLLLQGETADTELDGPSRATNAVVSETYLLAGANAITLSDPPIVSENGRHYPLYSYDYSDIFEAPPASTPAQRTTLRTRLQSLDPRQQLLNLTSWVQGRDHNVISAESQLRDILQRHHPPGDPPDTERPPAEHGDAYD